MTLSPEQTELAELLSQANRTELYQMCQRNGLRVPPGWPKEHYIGWLVGSAELNVGSGNIDYWRQGLIDFISAYWMRLRPQLTCPAKNLKDVPNPDPKPCFGCTDLRVVACVTSNKNEQMINDIRSKDR